MNKITWMVLATILLGGCADPVVAHRAPIVDHSVARVLDLLELPHSLAPRWSGLDHALR